MQIKRLLALTVLLAAAFVGLGYRLVDLQVVRHPELALEARGNTQYTNHLEPRRGDILDINGNLLATSYFVKTVCANPAVIAGHQTEVVRVLAPLLEMSEEELTKKLEPHVLLTKQGAVVTNQLGHAITNQYVMLKRKVPTETWEKIEIAMTNLPIPGIARAREKKLPVDVRRAYNGLRYHAVATDPVDEQVRSYPNGALAAHVLGFVGTTEETNKGLAVSMTTGMEGIEQRFDTKLKGVRGWRVSERDHQQRERVDMREQDVQPRDGLSVVLTIDSVIQHILEMALADGMQKHSPLNISGMVIRPRTGEILGMATLPNFDPNHAGLNTNALRNCAIANCEEPGSTFKIVVVSGALNDGIVRLTNLFNCEHGHFTYAGKILHDHKPYDILSVEGIITKSSNIGAAKIGLLMHEQRLYEYMRAFGFGTATGILPGEATGIVHPPDGKDSKGVFHKDWKWSELSITRIPMGHEVSATCLQMAMAMCAVANKGVLMQPMLVDRLIEPDGTVALKNQPQAIRTVISPEAASEMVQALKTVVTSDGTAVGAALTNYTVAGKTGTAQKPDLQHGGYLSDKFFSSFIGFFPADNPEICIYVAMDCPKDGHYGGDTAAPIFHEIAEKAANYLNIRPDKGNPTGVPEMAKPEITNLGADPVKTASAAPLEN